MDKTSEAFLKTKIGKQLNLNLNINIGVLFCEILFLMGFSLGLYTMGGRVFTQIETNNINAVLIPLVVSLYGFLVLTIVSGAKYISALMAYGQRTHKRN